MDSCDFGFEPPTAAAHFVNVLEHDKEFNDQHTHLYKTHIFVDDDEIFFINLMITN